MSKPSVLSEPILVGREKELAELESFLNSAVEGKGRTVFVSGEAGSGKTRLVREFLHSAATRGVAVMAGWCLSETAAPYFPFVEALNNYYATREPEEPSDFFNSGPLISPSGLTPSTITELGITSWLTKTETATFSKPVPVSPQVWKDQVFAGVANTLHNAAVVEPLILFIEDVQWADSGSLLLFHYVARAINNSEKILLLATYRSDELTSDSEGRSHPLVETMRMMRREELFKEIELSNLSQDNVSRIAENMLGGAIQHKLMEKLATESRGNPLFLIESLRMLNERRSLFQEDNQWRLTVDELGIPNKIKDVILRRLAILKFPQRRVLDAASVIGEEFDVEFLSSVLGQDSLEVLENLNQIARTTSLIRAEENHYRFNHSRSRETLYEEISSPLKRGYHNRIGEKLEGIKRVSLPLSKIAYHYAQSGNAEKALKFALAAGKDELAKYSNEQAIKHFQYVIEKADERHNEERTNAMEGLGDALAANCRYGEAIKTFDELASTGPISAKLRAIRKASDAAYAKGDEPDLLIDYAKKAEELDVKDRLEVARIIDNRGKAWAWAGRGDFKMDLADYDFALRVFEEENSVADLAEALRRTGSIRIAFNDSREQGLGELLRSVSIFRELGDVRKEIITTLTLGEGFSISSLFPEEKKQYVKVLNIGEKLGIFDELALASMYLSGFYEDDENLKEALNWSLKALEYSKKTDANYIQGTLYAVLTRQYALLEDMEHADEYFNKMDTNPTEICAPEFSRQSEAAKIIYFASKGRWEESMQVAEKARERAQSLGYLNSDFPGIEAFYKGNIAWVFEKQGRFEEAKILRDRIQEIPAQIERQAETRFGQANLQLSVMVQKNVQVGEDFEMRIDLVNVARSAATQVKICDAIPAEFNVVSLSPFCSLKDRSLVMNDRDVGPFQVETIKLKLKTSKTGSYSITPRVTYVDSLGRSKDYTLTPFAMTAELAKPNYEVLPGRVTTGTLELDKLLLGGIPQGNAIVLASPSCDEREQLVRSFLIVGVEADETTFYVTADLRNAAIIAEEHKSNSWVFLCNPRADIILENISNIIKQKGVDNLTEIDIALTKAFRTLSSFTKPRRFCVEILSDILLQHHALITRKWLSALLPELKSKGFTTLAVIDPRIHSAEEVQAVLGLFDGEIRLAERESAAGMEKSIRVVRLYNQRYFEGEVVLTSNKSF